MAVLGELLEDRNEAFDLVVVGGCRTHDPSEGFRAMQLLPVFAALGLEGTDE